MSENIKTNIDQSDKKRIYLLSFLIPLIMFVGLALGLRLYPLSDNTILYSDMNNQFVTFYNFFKNIFSSNDNFIYTFYKNLGGDMVGFTAYYLTNPFQLILFLFPYKMMPLGIYIMEAIMLSTAGLTFQIYITNVYKKSSLIFSTSYAFMGYVFVYFTLSIYFCNIILLPIVIMGFHKMMEEDGKVRKSLIYILFLTASIITNYYIGYMLCLFMVLYFVYYCISKSEFSLKMLFKFAVNSILGVLLSCFYLVPVAFSLRGQKNSPDASIMGLKRMFKLTSLWRNLLPFSYNGDYSNAALPNIYVGLVPVLCIAVYLLSKKVKLSEKIAALFLIASLIVSMYIKPLNIIWHAFNEPVGFSHRFAFYLSFVLVTIGFLGYESVCSEKINKLAELLNQKNGLKVRTTVNIISAFILVFVCSELFLNAHHSLRTQNAKTESEYAQFYDRITPVIDNIKSLEDKDSLYRIEKDIQYTMEDPMAFSYIGLSHNSSCETDIVKNFMGKMGFRNQGIWAFYNQGSTAFADSFLGVKYFVSRFDSTEKEYELIADENDTYTLLNENALGLMSFVNTDDINSVNMENENLFEIQNEIAGSYDFGGTLYSEASIPTIRKSGGITVSDEFLAHAKDINANVLETDKVKTYKDGSDEDVEYIEFDVEVTKKRQNLYLYFTALEKQGARIYINGIDWDDYFSDWRWAIEKVGRFKVGDIVTVRIEAQDNLYLSGFYLYFEDIDAISEWRECASKLGTDSIDIKKISSSHIKGTLNSTIDGTLLMSIPYDKGWHVTIDGKKAPINRSLSALMSIDLTRGEHIIEMQYVPVGLLAGTIMTLIGIAVLIWMVRFFGNKNSLDELNSL